MPDGSLEPFGGSLFSVLQGFLRGFKGQLIHTYNKNSSVCRNSSYFQQLQGKTNVLLLGDTMGDLTMADGVQGVENILKIGFLNDKVGGGPGLPPPWPLPPQLLSTCSPDTRVLPPALRVGGTEVRQERVLQEEIPNLIGR